MKKIAIDIHGVLDFNPKYFVSLAMSVIKNGGEVHILTGSEWSEELERELYGYSKKILGAKIKYWTYFASVITILKENNEPMYFNHNRGHWCVNSNDTWDKIKGEYCKQYKINEIYDDTIEYRKYMPEFTNFFLYSHNPVEHEKKLKNKHLGSSEETK